MRTEQQILDEMDEKGLRIDIEALTRHEEAFATLKSPTRGQKVSLSRLRILKEMVAKHGKAVIKHEVKPEVGRIYVSGFNYTNFPKQMRDVVLPELGQKIIELDAKSCEMVALAGLSQDEVLLEDLKTDIHTARAKRERIPRDEAKRKNFAAMYNGDELPWKKADAFLRKVQSAGRGSGKAVSGFGTKRDFSETADADKRGRQAMSHTVSSTAAELIRKDLQEVGKENFG